VESSRNRPPYRLLLVDVDGTLVGPDTYPTERVTAAIRAVRERGVAVSLCTGRATEACYHLLRHLQLQDIHIFFNGAAIIEWPGNDAIYLRALPPEPARRLVHLAREHDLFLEIYSHNYYFVEHDNAITENQRRKLAIEPVITDLVSLCGRLKIVKAQLVAPDDAAKEAARLVSAKMAGLCEMGLSIDPSNNWAFVNAIARNVSKGLAVQHLSDYLGVRRAEIMAVGDSYNDIDVLQVAGFSVALEPAPPELRAAADAIVPGVREDGLAIAIEKYILGAV
jgi:Cof subfamily protein (haloacid dehalogenase superfamily)